MVELSPQLKTKEQPMSRRRKLSHVLCIANSFNSTIIEIYDDRFRIS